MTKFSVVLATGSTVLAMLLAGCGADSSGDSAQDTAASSPNASTPPVGTVDNAKAGMFVVSYRNAFPALAADRGDGEITELFTGICGGIRAGETQDAVVADIVARTAATTGEAQAIYATAQYMC